MNDLYLDALLKTLEAAKATCALSTIDSRYQIGRLQGIYAGLMRAKELYEKFALDELDRDDFK